MLIHGLSSLSPFDLGAACRLRTSISLQYKAPQIAAGAIFLAAKFLKVELQFDIEKVLVQEFDITQRQLAGW